MGSPRRGPGKPCIDRAPFPNKARKPASVFTPGASVVEIVAARTSAAIPGYTSRGYAWANAMRSTGGARSAICRRISVGISPRPRRGAIGAARGRCCSVRTASPEASESRGLVPRECLRGSPSATMPAAVGEVGLAAAPLPSICPSPGGEFAGPEVVGEGWRWLVLGRRGNMVASVVRLFGNGRWS